MMANIQWAQLVFKKHLLKPSPYGVGFTSVVKSKLWLRHFALNEDNWELGYTKD